MSVGWPAGSLSVGTSGCIYPSWESAIALRPPTEPRIEGSGSVMAARFLEALNCITSVRTAPVQSWIISVPSHGISTPESICTGPQGANGSGRLFSRPYLRRLRASENDRTRR